MGVVEKYHEAIRSILESISHEKDSIARAAVLIADALAAERTIFLGHGGAHSGMLLEELFYRAGGLAAMNPMFDEAVYLGNGAVRATKMERTPGYGRMIIDRYGVGKDDVVLIITSVGITTMAVDEALEARARGARVIALTSTSFAENTPKDHPSRHPEGHNLHELADVFLNCHVPVGDAVLRVEGVEERFGASSTVALSYLAHQLTSEVVRVLHARGIEPELWQSSNTPGGDDANRRNIDKYRPRVRALG